MPSTIRRRKSLRTLSARQSERLLRYYAIRAEWLAKRPKPLRCDRDGEAERTLSIHHTRGRRDNLLFDTRYWKLLCMPCHCWVHSHPNEARALGFMAQPGDWGKL